MRRYQYVGPKNVLRLVQGQGGQVRVGEGGDVVAWIYAKKPRPNPDRMVTVTFIINLELELWIADRHSEHVVCAGGRDVLAAGEMTLAVDRKGVSVAEVTNQSTGYCPEPECWLVVDQVLTMLHLPHPGGFSDVFIFRRCEKCDTINIVKDNWFECPCGAPLSKNWNFAKRL